MSTSNINVRIDSELKENANALFKKLGLNMTTAISMFLQMSLNNNGLPFNVTLTPNSETKAAFDETEEILKHPERYKRYDSFDELAKEVLGENV